MDTQCSCDEAGRRIRGGYYQYHWFSDGGGWSTRCREQATQEDGLCGECRDGHPRRIYPGDDVEAVMAKDGPGTPVRFMPGIHRILRAIRLSN